MAHFGIGLQASFPLILSVDASPVAIGKFGAPAPFHVPPAFDALPSAPLAQMTARSRSAKGTCCTFPTSRKAYKIIIRFLNDLKRKAREDPSEQSPNRRRRPEISPDLQSRTSNVGDTGARSCGSGESPTLFPQTPSFEHRSLETTLPSFWCPFCINILNI